MYNRIAIYIYIYKYEYIILLSPTQVRMSNHIAIYFFSMVQQPLVGQGLLNVQASRTHSDTPHLAGLLWTSDQPDAETLYLRTHNTHKRQTSMPPAVF
jgi:hypothetical protein